MDAPFSVSRLWAVVRHNRDFRRLYAANAISQIGDWFNVVALFSLSLVQRRRALFAPVELTGKGEAVAIAP
ncbi:MAG: hypothetical protein ABR567_22850 [Myxococcales bacterium]|nr:hypothetical protein [Myxococcales bacterium]